MNLFMLRNIKNIVFAFVFGIAGGVFADQILWPYFIERPLFYKYRLEQPPVYITEKNEIVVQENTALKDAIEKSEKYLISIKTAIKSGKFMISSGVIVSSDGLVVALSETIPQGGAFSLYINNDEVEGQVLKRNISEDKNLTGSPLFNIKGELLGLNIVDSSGNVSAVPISKIKSFLGF